MRNKAILAPFMVLFFLGIGSGQTASDIKTKYGPPVDVLSVSKHVWMTPEYAANGQICRAALYAKRVSPEAYYVSNDLPLTEVIGILNQIVPLGTRGTRKELFGATQTSAALAWTTFEYENVRISFWVTFGFGNFADMERKGVPFGGKTPAPITTQSDDEYMAQNVHNPEMLISLGMVGNVRLDKRRDPTNRWTGAAVAAFRIIIGPAKVE